VADWHTLSPVTNRPAITVATGQPGLREGASMSLIRCRFCEHDSPADARFCSECGGALHLAPCPNCGAVNDVAANNCYQCRATLRGHGAEVPTSLPVSAVAVAPPRRRPSVIVATAASLATIVLGYYAYLLVPVKEARQPGATSAVPVVGAGRRQEPSALPAEEHRKPAEPPRAEAIPARRPADPKPASLPSGTPRLAAAVAAKEEERRKPTEPPRARAVTATSASLRQATAAESAQACPQGVAALDLCGAVPGKLAPPQTTAAAETAAGRQEPPRPQECTAGAAALGLCSPESNQGRD
jgi:hypothetical protein